MNAEDEDASQIEKREGGWKELKKMERRVEISIILKDLWNKHFPEV